jgi:hypothetical protein
MKAMILAAILFSSFAFSCSENGSSGFLPKNSLRIPVGTKFTGGISENSFNSIIDEVEAILAPVIASHGGKLSIIRNWEDAEVNAFATRSGSTWVVQMFGGLARHETITEDGFRLVLCHEIGHHIGGAPKKSPRPWSTAEGQADYWATLKCLRMIYENSNNQAAIKNENVPVALKDGCKKSFRNVDDQALCIRSALSGLSVSNLFGALEDTTVAFETPDKSAVTTTFEGHPEAQCRLDTFFQAAVCTVDHREEVSNSEEVKGTCHKTLGFKTGLRPTCWFKPKS